MYYEISILINKFKLKRKVGHISISMYYEISTIFKVKKTIDSFFFIIIDSRTNRWFEWAFARSKKAFLVISIPTREKKERKKKNYYYL